MFTSLGCLLSSSSLLLVDAYSLGVLAGQLGWLSSRVGKLNLLNHWLKPPGSSITPDLHSLEQWGGKLAGRQQCSLFQYRYANILSADGLLF